MGILFILLPLRAIMHAFCFSTFMSVLIASSNGMTQSFSSFLDENNNDLIPHSMISMEPTPIPTKRPSASIEPLRWTQSDDLDSTPSPTDSPNTVRRLQLWTCCKPDTTPESTEHRNSKLTHEPTEHPTPEPTSSISLGDGFCGGGLTGCAYYKNECEDICGCDWDRGFETCGDCSSGGYECISCEQGYTLSNGQCTASGAFTDDDDDAKDDTTPNDEQYLWMGIGIGFGVCLVIMLCMLMVIVLWRMKSRNKGVVTMESRDLHDDGIKLTDDQQLDAVGTTTIELNESLNLNETQPMEVTPVI